jgi:hypothetical protein
MTLDCWLSGSEYIPHTLNDPEQSVLKSQKDSIINSSHQSLRRDSDTFNDEDADAEADREQYQIPSLP